MDLLLQPPVAPARVNNESNDIRLWEASTEGKNHVDDHFDRADCGDVHLRGEAPLPPETSLLA